MSVALVDVRSSAVVSHRPFLPENAMSHRSRFLLSLVSSAALAAPLSAGDRLLFAGHGGAVMAADTDVGTFEYLTSSCWCPIQALAVDRERIYTSGDDELVRVSDLETGEFEGFFWPQLGPIHELAAARGVVFVGTPAGIVAAFRHDGTALGARTVPGGLTALAVHRESLFAAGEDGTIHRAPIAGGAFEPVVDVGLSLVRDMCVVGGDLALVDALGTVVRVSAETGAHTATFAVHAAPTTMAHSDGTLLFYYEGDLSGRIHQFDARTGAMLPGFQAPDDPVVMAVMPDRMRAHIAPFPGALSAGQPFTTGMRRTSRSGVTVR
jgi:outer membrane protein assembly factor BamB